MRQLRARTASLKEVQGMEAGDTTIQHPLMPCQLAAPSFTAITSSAVLCTLTENSFVTLCATLSHWIVSDEVTIPSEVRVNFNSDFSEVKTFPHVPAKKLVFSLNGRSSNFSTSSCGDSLKKKCFCYTWLFLSATTWSSSSRKALTETSAAELSLLLFFAHESGRGTSEGHILSGSPFSQSQEYVWLEETLKIIQSNTTIMTPEPQPQVPHPSLEHFQRHWLHYIPGQLILMPDHSWTEFFFLIPNLNLPQLSLQPFPFVLSLETRQKRLVPNSPQPPSRWLHRGVRFPQVSFSPQQPQFLQLLLMGHVF